MRYLLRFSLSVLLAFCMVFSNSYSAIANTTTEQSYDIMPLNVPIGWDISVEQALYNKNTDSFSFNSFGRVEDGASGFGNQSIIISGNLNDYQLGYRIGYIPETQYNLTNPSSHSSVNIDLSSLMLWFNLDGNNISLPFTLSSAAIPVQAYVVYDCSYEFQIFDGSAGYHRWIYDNSITFTEPVDVYTSNFGQWQYLQDGSYLDNVQAGFDVSINVPMLNYDNFMNDISVRNGIANYNTYISGDTILSDSAFIEDVFTDGFRFSYEDCYIYVLYDISQMNWVPFYNSFENSSLYFGDTLSYFMTINPSVFNDGKVNLNVYNVDSDNDFLFFSSISNGFSRVVGFLYNNVSGIVSNATDNANRIIQNTTQKVDEVKQGVVDVKNSVIETKNSILDLPNKLKEMLTGFFVPDEETINSKFAEFETLLSDRFGLIYQSAQIIHDFADSFQSQAVMLADTGGIIQLPSVTVNLVGTDFSFGGYDVDIIPDGFEFLQTAVRLATSMICTVVFINMCKNKLEAILR